eukprot:scaffold16308_cov79-Phaeocystis_antarctica.AAC.1
MDTMDIDCHPCASKQEQIGGRALQKEQLVKGSKWGSREDRTRKANGEFEVLCKLMREGGD